MVQSLRFTPPPSAAGSPAATSLRGGPARLLRLILFGAAFAAAFASIVAGAVIGYLAFLVASVEAPAPPRMPETTRLLDRTGEPLGTLHTYVDRRVVPLGQLPEGLVAAVLAAEDKGFYEHGAIDPEAVVRAMLANLRAGGVVEGGSTITQQYVKNVYTGGDQTFGRKLREVAFAIDLEERLSKNEILDRYLNTIFLGNGAYGVEAAALTYFDRHARKLNLLQSATIAGVIAAPSRYDPVRHPGRAERRRNYVLDQLAEMGYLSEQRAHRLAKHPLELDRSDGELPAAPYFADYVRRFLEERYGRWKAMAGGLRVSTTLDLSWQRAAERAVFSHLPDPNGPQAALVAIDPRTGEILAMVGGRDFRSSNFNLATQARRQTGSAFKTFVLAAALREGISPMSVFTGPSSVTIDDPRCEHRGEPWDVGNYGDSSAGTMPLVDGIAYSVNTIFAQLVVEVGPDRVAETARRMGIRSELPPVCSIALGTVEVTPLEMTSAYATLAAGGVYRKPTPVRVVRDSDRELIGRPVHLRGTRVLSRNVAATVTWALQGVVDHGTGTAQEYTNAWFCGYVRQLAACVWMGYPQGNVPMSGVTGGSIPAAIWQDFMTFATRAMRVRGFPDPSLEVYDAPIDVPLSTYTTASEYVPPAPDEGSGGGHGHGNGHGKDH